MLWPLGREGEHAMKRRLFLKASVLTAVAAPAILRAQGAWPNRPVKIINPYAPGGTSDVVVRALSPLLERQFGQPFIVENRAGAGGAVGTAAAATSPADGYTLLVTNTGPLAVSPFLSPPPTYDAQKSFSYITMFGGAPIVCAVKGDGPIKTMSDYAAAAEASPGTVTFGSSGVGSVGHLAGQLWTQEAKVGLQHVPFRGAGDAEQAVLGGHTVSLWNTVGAHAGGVRAGTLRGLAVTSATRIATVPDVPTVIEAGFPGAVATNWFLLAGPAGLPADIVARLRAAIAPMLAEQAMVDRWVNLGLVPLGDPTPPEIAAFVAKEAVRWEPVVRTSGA
jgi:tripartite-type tricarboxylate transporter receptor subunit TctC